MATPIAFNSTTARFSIPFLFQGQAQKEFYVNEAHTLIDTLLHAAVEEETPIPPSSPSNGQCWLIGPSATGEWTAKEGCIAIWINSAWNYIKPKDGMSVLKKSTGQNIRYHGMWYQPDTPDAPSGGTTIDAEARIAIEQILSSLKLAGLIRK